MVGLGARMRRLRFARMLSGVAVGLALALAPVAAHAQDVPRNETLILDLDARAHRHAGELQSVPADDDFAGRPPPGGRSSRCSTSTSKPAS